MSNENTDPVVATVAPTSPSPPDVRPTSPVRYRSFGRVCEILAVMSLAACVFVFGLGLQRLSTVLIIIVLLLALSLSMYKLAIHYAVNARMAEKALDEKGKALAASLRYKVTKARLETLKVAGVPQDVSNALAKLTNHSPLPEEEFLAELAFNHHTDLGLERTKEFKELILRYTKMDRKAETAQV